MSIILDCDFVTHRSQSHRSNEEVTLSLTVLLASRHMPHDDISNHLHYLGMLQSVGAHNQVNLYINLLMKELDISEKEVRDMCLLMCYKYSLN